MSSFVQIYEIIKYLTPSCVSSNSFYDGNLFLQYDTNKFNVLIIYKSRLLTLKKKFNVRDFINSFILKKTTMTGPHTQKL